MGFLSRHRVIGTVGRLEPQKRLDLLLRAFGAVRQRAPEARLVVVGDGSLRDRLEKLARKLGIGDACQFLGHRLDVAGLHDAFDMFVQSSEYEGTPNAVLEAMAMGTPLVATDVGGTSELAFPGIHALVVPPRNAPALAGAIQDVLGDPAAAKRRAGAARDHVEQDLSFATRTRRLETIYDELMASRRHSPSAAGAPDTVGARSA
jgi:glycosyltransferase involved in cell wall biosynthesis